MRDERELRSDRLSLEVAMVLVRLEKKREVMRKARAFWLDKRLWTGPATLDCEGKALAKGDGDEHIPGL